MPPSLDLALSHSEILLIFIQTTLTILLILPTIAATTQEGLTLRTWKPIVSSFCIAAVAFGLTLALVCWLLIDAPPPPLICLLLVVVFSILTICSLVNLYYFTEDLVTKNTVTPDMEEYERELGTRDGIGA